MPFRSIDVNKSTANAIIYENYINDYGNYTMQGADSYFIYELPFAFSFMGRNITRISANTNGLIELLESNEDCDFWYGCGNYGTHQNGNHIGNMDAIFATQVSVKFNKKIPQITSYRNI